MSSELFQMVSHALAPLDPVVQRDMQLHWCAYALNDCGWVLDVGYERDGDPFDDGTIHIKRVVLNTGQRDVDLTPNDLDKETWLACEEYCNEDWRAERIRESRP